MKSRLCRLEGEENAPSFLDAYDPPTGQWRFPPNARFWRAVQHAHSLGRRGKGHKIAVIDAAFRTNFPALRGRVKRKFQCVRHRLPGYTGLNSDHGTEVLLLMAAVAPECRFDLYSVQREGGGINEADVAYAIDQAASSDADIINLSLGFQQTVPDLENKLQHIGSEAISTLLGGPSSRHGKYVLSNQLLPDPNCELCNAAAAAARNGKPVFAAVGNEASDIYCPARAEEVFAVGFQTTEQRVALPIPGGETLIGEGSLVETQSLFLDLSLEEVPKVLGTSFASPLYSGVAALGVTAAEFCAYNSAMPSTADAAIIHRQVKIESSKLGHVTQEMSQRLQQAYRLFLDAMRMLPHIHSQTEMDARQGSNTGLTIADPARCIACGFLAYPLYVDFGLLLLEFRHLQQAKGLLEVASAIAPWSDSAAADLGRTLEELGNLKEALNQYDRACRIAPGVATYEESRQRIANKLSLCNPAFCGQVHDAAAQGDVAVVRALLQANPDLAFSRDNNGLTPLHFAARNGHKDVAELLLANKAEVNAKTNNGRTPLHEAAEAGHKSVGELLLVNKADVKAKTYRGYTALHLAAFKGYLDVTELLLAYGANVNARNNLGYTPLQAAMAHQDVADLLRQHGGIF